MHLLWMRKKYLRRAAAAVGHGLAAIALISAVPAQAATVDYTTTATFSCVACVITSNGSEGVKVVYGTGENTAMLEFFGAPSGTSVISDGDFVSAAFGYIQANATGRGSAINGTFQLGIRQTNPGGPLTGMFPTAMLSGAISISRSTAYATFGSSPNPEVTLGGDVTYELDTSKNINNKTQYGYTIVSPATGKGQTSLQGNISATPEPRLLTLTSIGFLGLVVLALRGRFRPAT
jgi:hypothetical protein